jgi:energy-converting hydrogenase A subunit Q
LVKINQTTDKPKKTYKPIREVDVDYDVDHELCKDCESRPCLISCPVDAIHEVSPDNQIEIDEKCVGCVLCREACPYNAIKMKTTLSEPIQENIPNINSKLCRQCGACVDACRTGAIQLISSGKEEAHSEIDEDKCVRCGYCSRVCPTEAIKYGEILPRSVAGGKAIVVNQKKCIGCMTCTRVCPSRGAINVGKFSKLPFINPSYCARCEECMDVCPSTAIKYSSRKRAYQNFSKIKTMEIVSELLEKESSILADETVKVDSILNKIAQKISINHHESEFSVDVTSMVEDEFKGLLEVTLELGDVGEIIEATIPKREILVLEEECIGCSACIEQCPVDCIELEIPSPVHISDECVYCGKCVDNCPVNAIILTEEYFEASEGHIIFNRRKISSTRTGEISIDHQLCQSCGVCVNKCPVDAMSMIDDSVKVDPDLCILCGECEAICPLKAVKLEEK